MPACCKLCHETVETPIGRLHLYASGDGLVSAGFQARDKIVSSSKWSPSGSSSAKSADEKCRKILADMRRRVRLYFAGDLEALAGVRLSLSGSPFQLRVWRALCRLQPGSTISYGELARRIGSPSAARAVGAACKSNPIALFVPCHRVIGASGNLTGYACGLSRKEFLLRHEGVL